MIFFLNFVLKLKLFFFPFSILNLLHFFQAKNFSMFLLRARENVANKEITDLVTRLRILQKKGKNPLRKRILNFVFFCQNNQ